MTAFGSERVGVRETLLWTFIMSFVGSFFGPMYWGFVVSTALVGATLTQGYMYYNRSRDPLSIQLAIALMLILDLSSTVVIAATVFHFFIVNFGNYATFQSIPPEWVAETTLTAAVTCIVQLFFATRIWIIMQKYTVFGRFERAIPGIIVCTALLALMAGIGKTVIIASNSPRQLSGMQMIIATSLEEGLAFLSDLFTTSTLCCILASTRGGLCRTTSSIRRLFFFILNRGILVTILQIGMLVAFVTSPSSMYWAPFHFSKSKLYTNTLLAMLNSRTRVESIAPRTPHIGQSVPLQDVSTGEAANQVGGIADQDRASAWENASVNRDGLRVPAVLPGKHSDC